ncbi:hypothetical protein TWF481_011472 [Arthrobotrys musiformis]|uniref:3CxxC-type domain-containing protein n=1 Tax=Arthrobotrys musiformis TaxID=47236 RepID=A0AAV9VZV6_9PEZI
MRDNSYDTSFEDPEPDWFGLKTFNPASRNFSRRAPKDKEILDLERLKFGFGAYPKTAQQLDRKGKPRRGSLVDNALREEIEGMCSLELNGLKLINYSNAQRQLVREERLRQNNTVILAEFCKELKEMNTAGLNSLRLENYLKAERQLIKQEMKRREGIVDGAVDEDLGGVDISDLDGLELRDYPRVQGHSIRKKENPKRKNMAKIKSQINKVGPSFVKSEYKTTSQALPFVRPRYETGSWTKLNGGPSNGIDEIVILDLYGVEDLKVNTKAERRRIRREKKRQEREALEGSRDERRRIRKEEKRQKGEAFRKELRNMEREDFNNLGPLEGYSASEKRMIRAEKELREKQHFRQELESMEDNSLKDLKLEDYTDSQRAMIRKEISRRQKLAKRQEEINWKAINTFREELRGMTESHLERLLMKDLLAVNRQLIHNERARRGRPESKVAIDAFRRELWKMDRSYLDNLRLLGYSETQRGLIRDEILRRRLLEPQNAMDILIGMFGPLYSDPNPFEEHYTAHQPTTNFPNSPSHSEYTVCGKAKGEPEFWYLFEKHHEQVNIKVDGVTFRSNIQCGSLIASTNLEGYFICPNRLCRMEWESRRVATFIRGSRGPDTLEYNAMVFKQQCGVCDSLAIMELDTEVYIGAVTRQLKLWKQCF